MDKPPALSCPSVDLLAHALMAVARENPTLLRRPDTLPAIRPDGAFQQVSASPQSPTAWMPLPPPPGSEADSYFGQLLSLAVASARQAEDAARQAGAIGRSAKRAIVIAMGVGALGAAVGMAGLLGKGPGDVGDARLAAVARDVHALADAQRQASDQLAKISAGPLDLTGAAPVVQRGAAPGDLADVALKPAPSATVPGELSDDAGHRDAEAASLPAGAEIGTRGGLPDDGAEPPIGTTIEVTQHPVVAAVPQQDDQTVMPSAPMAAAPVSTAPSQSLGFAQALDPSEPAAKTYAALPPRYQHRTIRRTSRVTGSPVGDLRRLVVAAGHGVRAIFQ